MQNPTSSARSEGRGLLRAAIFLFLVFFVNLLAGKADVSFKWDLPHLGNLAEFLLLAAASTVLIWAALKREAVEKKSDESDAKED